MSLVKLHIYKITLTLIFLYSQNLNSNYYFKKINIKLFEQTEPWNVRLSLLLSTHSEISALNLKILCVEIWELSCFFVVSFCLPTKDLWSLPSNLKQYSLPFISSYDDSDFNFAHKSCSNCFQQFVYLFVIFLHFHFLLMYAFISFVIIEKDWC